MLASGINEYVAPPADVSIKGIGWGGYMVGGGYEVGRLNCGRVERLCGWVGRLRGWEVMLENYVVGEVM